VEAKAWQAFSATLLLERSKFGLNELLGSGDDSIANVTVLEVTRHTQWKATPKPDHVPLPVINDKHVAVDFPIDFEAWPYRERAGDNFEFTRLVRDSGQRRFAAIGEIVHVGREPNLDSGSRRAVYYKRPLNHLICWVAACGSKSKKGSYELHPRPNT
jgi:hypothetical protein